VIWPAAGDRAAMAAADRLSALRRRTGSV